MQYIAIFTGNPTAGGTDGAEVSQDGVMSTPVTAGIAVGGSDVIVPLAVRCASGYEADGNITVSVETKSGSNYSAGNEFVKVATSQNGSYGNSITLSGVDDTNTLFYCKLKANAAAGTYTSAALRLQGTVSGV